MADRLLVSDSTVKEFLDLEGLKSYDDKRLSLLNKFISGTIEERLKRSMLANDFTEAYDGTGDNELILYNYPIISITSVVDDNDVTLVAGTDYRILANTGILKMISGVWVRGTYYTVISRAGFEQVDIPNSIQMAACMWIGEVFNKIKSKSFGVVSNVKFGEEVVNYINDGPSPAVGKLLDRYQRSQVVTTRN